MRERRERVHRNEALHFAGQMRWVEGALTGSQVVMRVFPISYARLEVVRSTREVSQTLQPLVGLNEFLVPCIAHGCVFGLSPVGGFFCDRARRRAPLQSHN